MDHKKVVSLLFCFLFLITIIDKTYPREKCQTQPKSWFHMNANIFTIKYILPINMSSNTSLTIDVLTPENNTFQKLINILSEPNPNATFTDENGLRRFRYELTTSFPEFLNITIHYIVMIIFSSLPNDFYEGQSQENIPEEIQEKFTKPSPYIESDDSNIVGNATMVSRNAINTYAKAKVSQLFNFVSDRTLFIYNENAQNIPRDSSSHIRGALWALKNRKGVCFDFAHLFVALLRAEGIPSRVAEGIILDNRYGFIVHDWAEVYFPETGWIPFDPT